MHSVIKNKLAKDRVAWIKIKEEAAMAETEDINNPEERPTAENYIRMNEKDLEIQKTVIRLQNRISKILFLMDAEVKQK